MDITLTEHQEAIINQQLQSGGYRSPAEVVDEALSSLMLNNDPELRARIDAGIDRGLADVAAGRTTPLREAAEELKAEIRKKYNLA